MSGGGWSTLLSPKPAGFAHCWALAPRLFFKDSRVAQLVEQATVNRRVAGSSPASGAFDNCGAATLWLPRFAFVGHAPAKNARAACIGVGSAGGNWTPRHARSAAPALEYAATAEERGLQVIICAAGGAAHLGGFIAAKTILPVLAVPLASTPLGGLDALLAMVQMPAGVPVGTLAIGKWGATNAGVLAVQIIGTKRPELREKMKAWRAKRAKDVLAQTLP